MKLLTKELRQLFAKTGSQEGKGDQAVVIAKYFVGSATWYATEFDGEDTFFGYVCLGDHEMAEWGSFSLSELEGTRTKFGPVERDLYWAPKPMGEAMKELCGGYHR